MSFQHQFIFFNDFELGSDQIKTFISNLKTKLKIARMIRKFQDDNIDRDQNITAAFGLVNHALKITALSDLGH